MAEEATGKRKRALTDDTQRQRLRALAKADLDSALVSMMGEGAGFRGIQREALQAIAKGKRPVVTVMGTGGGKNLLFMLPAFAAKGDITVMMIPLLALKQDIIQRLKKARIACGE